MIGTTDNTLRTALRKYGPSNISRRKPGYLRSIEVHSDRLRKWWPKYQAEAAERLRVGRIRSGISRKGSNGWENIDAPLKFDRQFAKDYKDKHLVSVLQATYGESDGFDMHCKLRRKGKARILAQVDKDARNRLAGRMYCRWIVLAGIFGLYK
jgi:hypothetical protein